MNPAPGGLTVRPISIGGRSKTELLELLAASGVQLNSLATNLFEDGRFTTSPVSIVVRTVEASVGDLGLTDGGTFAEILAHASERCLLPCPLELGPHLRLQYTDQPEGSAGKPQTRNQAPYGSLTVASMPVSVDESVPCGFYLRRIEGVLWLRGYQSWPGHHWNPGDRFIFVEQTHAD